MSTSSSGARPCRVTWQRPDGSFDNHDVDCLTLALTALPDGLRDLLGEWTEPGRMLLVEHNADGIPLVLHASLDRGATWQRIEIEDRNWDGTMRRSRSPSPTRWESSDETPLRRVGAWLILVVAARLLWLGLVLLPVRASQLHLRPAPTPASTSASDQAGFPNRCVRWPE